MNKTSIDGAENQFRRAQHHSRETQKHSIKFEANKLQVRHRETAWDTSKKIMDGETIKHGQKLRQETTGNKKSESKEEISTTFWPAISSLVEG